MEKTKQTKGTIERYKDPDKKRAYAREYYYQHKTDKKDIARRQKWRLKNKDKVREIARNCMRRKLKPENYRYKTDN